MDLRTLDRLLDPEGDSIDKAEFTRYMADRLKLSRKCSMAALAGDCIEHQRRQLGIPNTITKLNPGMLCAACKGYWHAEMAATYFGLAISMEDCDKRTSNGT